MKGTSRTGRALAVAFACLLALSTVVPFAAATAGVGVGTTDGTVVDGKTTDVAGAEARVGETVSASLQAGSGPVEVLVSLEGASSGLAPAAADLNAGTLQRHAEQTQAGVLAFAADTDGVAVQNRFWIANAVLLELDAAADRERVLRELTALEHVEAVSRNARVRLPGPRGLQSEATTRVSNSSGYRTTYGVDQVNATEVWSQYDTMGDGVKVAVLDTGVSVDHPDIDLFTEDASDSTYPGGWAEFADDGSRVQGSTPHDTGYHGTHTSGTVAGGNASGTYIGVAPNVSLMHGLVLPGGSGSTAQIIGGMQWAVANGASVISMSLGAPGQSPAYISAVRNARAQGVAVVTSAGNAGAGVTSSPGNVYESIAVGATNASLGIAPFSGGEVIDTSEAWGLHAPADWPEQYTVPDVSAPGVNVTSAVPSGTFEDPDAVYGTTSGTSMAAPHVAGTVALVLAANGETSVEQTEQALTGTAFKPGECTPSCDPRDGTDSRYGAGVVDAKGAVDQVAADSGVTGQVRDAGGDGVANATVALGNGYELRTTADGEFTLPADPGTHQVTAAAFGYESRDAQVTVEDGFVEQNFTLAETLDVALQSGPADELEAGRNATATLRVANLETLTVAAAGDYPTGSATLYVDGERQSFGTPVDLGGVTGTVTVTVATTDGVTGNLSLTHTLEGLGESTSVTTDATVYGDTVPVALVDTANNDRTRVLPARLERALPARYEVEYLPAAALAADLAGATAEYETFVVKNLTGDDAAVEAFVDATSDPATGVVWLDNYGAASEAINQRSAATGTPAGATDTVYPDSFGLDVSYTVRADHPIFEGVAEPGESVQLYESATFRVGSGFLATYYSGFHSSFASFEGTHDGRLLADVTVDENANGGLAADRYTSTVVAASLARNVDFAPDREFTDDANAVLGNTVQWATDTPAVVPQNAAPEQLDPGESTTVTVDVEDLEEYEATLRSKPGAVSREDVSLQVDGKIAAFGQALAFDDRDGELNVTLAVSEDATGVLAVDHRFVAGSDDSTYDLRTGPTSVYDAPMEVPADTGSLQRAVWLTHSGGEILLGDGTLRESVTVGENATWGIGSDDLTIRAADGANATLAAPAGAESVLRVEADGVTLRGVAVNATTPAGERADGVFAGGDSDLSVAGFTAENVRVTGADTAFTVGGYEWPFGPLAAPGATLDGVTATDSATGVDARDATDLAVTDSTFAVAEDGIEARSSHGLVIDDTTVTSTGSDATGVWLDETDSATVTDSTITAAVGIDRWDEPALGAAPLEVRRTNITASDTALALAESAPVVFRQNDVDGGVGVAFAYDDDSYFVPGSLEVRYNDLSGVETAFEASETYGERIDARLNYFGPRGPALGSVVGPVTTDPFLTAPPSDLAGEPSDWASTTRIAIDAHVDAGGTYALGIPAPVSGDVSDLLGENFMGAAYGFDTGTQSWEMLTADDDVGALRAIVVTPTEDARAVLNFQSGGPSTPGSVDLAEGWNFVSPPQFARAGTAFDAGSAELSLAIGEFAEPTSHVGPRSELSGVHEFSEMPGTGPNVSAFAGYFVFAEEAGAVPGYLTTNPTASQLYERLGVDAPFGDGEAAADEGEVSTTEAVADALDRERGNATAAVADVLVDALADDFAGGSVADADVQSAVTGVLADAYAAADGPDERAVVAAAVERALRSLTGSAGATQAAAAPA